MIVLEDMDARPGRGALFGEIHAHIGRAPGSIGYVTNGAVRDLPGIGGTGFHVYAGGDMHGVVSVPAAIAGEIPKVAAELLAAEGELIQLCQPGTFLPGEAARLDRTDAICTQVETRPWESC